MRGRKQGTPPYDDGASELCQQAYVRIARTGIADQFEPP